MARRIESVNGADYMADSLPERLNVFTHWVVNTKPQIHEMVEWLWTNSEIFAVIPAEQPGELVLCTDQAGWDSLADVYARRPDVNLGTPGR